MPNIVITKSNFLAGLSCPKLLWCIYNAPEKISPKSEATQALLDQGKEVGDLAKMLYPGGIEIPRSMDSVKETQKILRKRVTLFEASFAYKNAYCKVDILLPAGKGEWDIIEVKSATKVKEEHIPDVAFQWYCLNGAGLKVRRCHLMYINNEYERHGDINPKQFFAMDDITEEVSQMLPGIEDKIGELVAVIRKPTMPKPLLGTECLEPWECPVHADDMPEIAELYYAGKKVYPLINKGIKLFKDLPDDFKLNDKQRIQKEAVLTGKRHVEALHIKKFLKELQYPLYFLDFETVYPAIPLFDGTRPYQHVPFQLSLHVMDAKGAVPRHIEFLADSSADPRAKVVETLKAIGSKGTVLAYNMVFEKSVIEDLIEVFPKAKHLQSIVGRLNDLLILFRNFWLYDPAQHGSNSLKDVLPALTGKGYEHLEISAGDDAARKFFEVIYKGRPIGQEENRALRRSLLLYCEHDTKAMIEILKVLQTV
jgi:hypothetical protein